MENGTKKEILPIPGKKNVLITSALPYVNNVPHLGNIIGSVLSADVFSRYCKARGHPTLFVCGTDEYGTATETKAIEEKITPQELCDKYNKLHKEIYDWFEIGFDHFGRTPTTEQTEIAQDIFTKLNANGFLEERPTMQPYCQHPEHENFLADRYVEGECPLCGYNDARGDQCDKCGNLLDPFELIKPRCKLHQTTTPVPRETRHIFLLLDKLQEQEEAWVKKAQTVGKWSQNSINITNEWLHKGLLPRGITRDLKWGTAVPLKGYENKVLYVWFDACIGYVSITATYTKHWEKWWRNPDDVTLYQFMGKDNVPFHSVVFPCSQLGTGDKWTMVNTLSTTEYLNYEGGKFSKSRGIGVFGSSAKETGIPADRPETSDTEFKWDAFIRANNNELVANFGNFVNRILKYVNSANYDSVVPAAPELEADPDLSTALKQHIKDANEILRRYREEMDAVHLKAGIAIARELSSLGNKLLQDHTVDNNLFKNHRQKCDAVVNLAANHVHLLASVIAPYIPATARSILEQLQAELLIIPDDWEARSIPADHKIGKAAHLFQNIKESKQAEWTDLFGGDELKKVKQAEADKKAAKKAEKDRKKAEKEKKRKEGKEGVEGDLKTDDGITEVTNATKEITLQTS
ncbi:hypothetical protein LTR10_007800 [Elasticomyces elasticus]|nr:hypothetical protein LTR10_007800 [Elasticomyces elasticus]KAK4970800.1 hypothetical protein LTR42_007777 [Elasticomyces elasticus]